MKKCEFCGTDILTRCGKVWAEEVLDGNREPYCLHHECYMEQGHTGDCGKHNVGHTVWACRDALVAQLKDTRYVLSEVSKARDIIMKRYT